MRKRWMNKVKNIFGTSKAPSMEDSQLWLTKTLDLLPKPFFLLNYNEKRISFSNAAARRMMGLDYADHVSSQIYGVAFSLFDVSGNLVPANNLPSVRILRGELVHGEAFLLVSKTGKYHIKVFSQEIPAMYGQPASALIIFQDITALKETEGYLRRTQAELNEAIEIAQVGFWSVDTLTMATTVSPQLLRQFGLGETQFDGKLETATSAIHPEDRLRVLKAIELSMSKGTPYHIEYRVVHPDGNIRWIEAKSGGDGEMHPEVQRFSGTTIDITSKVIARKALEANEKELRVLADSMPQIVWSALPDGKLDYFNQIWFDYSGSTLADNAGDLWTKFVHPEDFENTAKRWQKALSTNANYENEFRLRAKDGTYRWFVARARPIFEDAGPENAKVKKWYGTNTDIHEQKTVAVALEEARAAAERANVAKSQFLANMSHEIRTPLGAIMGFSELMKDNGLARSERDEYISIIERNSSQLLRIIDDILDLSKVEAGMLLIEAIDFSLPEALTDFSSLMGLKAREKGIQFNLKAETSLPTKINSDPTRIRQILMNVVGNAIKFTDKGFVEMRVRYENGFLEIDVEDTGRGISEEQAVNLFQAFSQADASTTRKYGGTGLGLVLTRSLSEALGGHFILRQSVLGSGSTFSIRLKASTSVGAKLYAGLGPESALERAANSAGQLAGMNILLVEDSPDNQALISIFVSRAGARVSIASDGEKGLQMATNGEYDVILMDVQMPIMDGITAVRKMRDLGYDKPVVALTAHAMKEERARCLAAGFTDFLPKPVVREDLVNKILSLKNQKKT